MSGGKIQYLNGLGLVSKTKRVIKPGRHYDIYFPKPERLDEKQKNKNIINEDGSVDDTVAYCEKIVKSTLNDTKKIAHIFRHKTLEQTCNVIFNFIYDHIKYEEDKPNVEQLRRPARAWEDRTGDCDCMSIFASSILTNLGIKHSFRIVKMYGRSWYQHIYVIVPKPGKTDMSVRSNYIVIDPVLDKFNQEAPKINHKKDFKMENLAGVSGIPIQYLNGVNSDLKFGEEFNGLEGFDGTIGELGREWDRRMKTHLVNTHAYITRNPKRVSAFYDTQKLAGAYKELIGAWDSEVAREGALDRLSKIEESFLRPELQGLGDILNGPDDRLFGLINADLNEVMGLGRKNRGGGGGGGKRPATKKAAARKAARASKKPVFKRGPFTKIKNANKKIVAAHKKVGKKALELKRKVDKKVIAIAKKIGKNVIKSATWPIIAGGLVAFKTNFGRIASRAYWGLFPKDEAMQHGVLPDYWEASNRLYKFILDIWTKKLMGAESTLRKAIISGRGAKVAKRGTSGLGDVSELTTNGFEGLCGAGYDDAAALITAFAAILGPTLAFANKNMKGKKKTANSEPETEATKEDTGEEEEVSQSEADHVEDNYNNEVAEGQPEQEPEADGTVVEEVEGIEGIEGIDGEEREYDPQFGDLGKKIKSKPATKVAKRVKKDKVAKKATKVAKKVAKKEKKAIKKGKAPVKTNEQKTVQAIETAQKYISDAQKLKLMPKNKLVNQITNTISKLPTNHKLKNLTPAQIDREADLIINKKPEQIEREAEVIEQKELVRYKTPAPSTELDTYTPTEVTESPKVNSAPAPAPKEEVEVKEGMSTGAKVGLGLVAAALGLLLIKGGKKKSDPAMNGLSGPKKHSKKALVEEGKKIQKKLAKQGVKLPHGYETANRKKGVGSTNERIIKIK